MAATTTDDAIFLNFLWVYIPIPCSDSSHRFSTGSTMVTLLSSVSDLFDNVSFDVLEAMLSLVGRVEVGLLLVGVVQDDDEDLLLEPTDVS